MNCKLLYWTFSLINQQFMKIMVLQKQCIQMMQALRNLTYSSNLSIELEVNTFERSLVADKQIKAKKVQKN